MNTDHFEYVIEIARTGSLSKAAAFLGVTQPVLTRYLAGLEKYLGVELFYYENRRFHITQAGEVYLSCVTRMRNIEAQMIRRLNRHHALPEKTLTVGISPFWGGKELAYFYPRLIEAFPGLDLQSREGNTRELMALLKNKEISCFMNLYDPDTMPGTKFASYSRYEILLGVPTLHPVASKGGSIQAPTTITSDDLLTLRDLPFACMCEDASLGNVCLKACARYGFYPQPVMRTANAITIDHLLASGTYAGFFYRNGMSPSPSLRFFSFEEPLFIEGGLIFSNQHDPSDIELYFYHLETSQQAQMHPDALYINPYGRMLEERIQYGHKNI